MNSVTITLNEDGTYTVEGQEPYAEPAEGGMADMAEDQAEGAQSFQSAEEACQAAIAMLGGGESAEPMIEGEEDFVQGFKGARGIEQGF